MESADLKKYLMYKNVFDIENYLQLNKQKKGGSNDLVIIEEDWQSRGREIESWHRILGGSFTHLLL